MMTGAEVLIKIRTLFERKGSAEATDALKQTAATAKQTGQQVAQMGRSGSDSMNIMGSVSALMRGNFQEAANAAIPLLEKTKATGISLTQLSIAGAALSAVVAGLRAMSEWADAAAMRIAGIQMGNLTNQVNSSAKAYDALLESMNKVTAEKDATLAYNNSMVESYTRQALAINELNKQAELSTTTDESKRQEIESRYASKAASISGMSDVQKEANERKRSFEREREIEAAKAASEVRKQEALQEAQKGLVQGQNANITASASNGFWGGFFAGKMGKVDGYQAMAKEAGALTGKSIDAAKAEDERQAQLETERVELLRKRDVARSDATAGVYTRAGADIASGTARGDRDRAEQEAKYNEFERLKTIMERLDTSDVNAIISYMERAAKMMELTAPYIKRIADSAERTVRAFDDNEARQRNIQ